MKPIPNYTFFFPDGSMAGDEEGPTTLTYKQALAFRPLWETRFECKLKIGRIPKNVHVTGEHIDKTTRGSLNQSLEEPQEQYKLQPSENLAQQIEVMQVARTLNYKQHDRLFMEACGFTYKPPLPRPPE